MLRWLKKKMSDNSGILSSIEEDETDDDDDDAKQEVKSNMNSSLRSMFSDTADEFTDKCTDESVPRCDWDPPQKSGLCNSFPILQQIYIRKLQRGEHIDYFEILKDDVRNMRPITTHQMEYIKNRGKWELVEIIEILDAVNKTLIGLAGLNEDN